MTGGRGRGATKDTLTQSDRRYNSTNYESIMCVHVDVLKVSFIVGMKTIVHFPANTVVSLPVSVLFMSCSAVLQVLSTLRSNHAVCIPIGICTLGVRGNTCVVKGRYRYYGSDRDRDRDRRNVNICEWDKDGDIYNRIKSSKKLTNSTSTGEISSRRTNRNKNKIKKQKQDTVRTLRCSLLLCEDNDMGCFFDDD